MKAAILKSPKCIDYEDIVSKSKDNKQLEVEIKYCGICGSDISKYLGDRLLKHNLVLGHEFCGIWRNKLYAIIPKTNNGFMGSNIDGGMAERIYVDSNQLFSIPELEDQPILGTLIEPMSNVIHAIRKSRLLFTDNVKIAIVGDGTIGSILYLVLTEQFKVDILGRNQKKEDEVYDIVFECSGSTSGFNKALHILKHNGWLIDLGIIYRNQLTPDVDMDLIPRKELTIIGSWQSDFREDWDIAYRFIKEHKEECLKLIDKVYDLKDTNKAFEEKIKNNYKKVVIKI